MQSITPDAHGVAVLLLIAVALFLFTRDRLPLETSSLIVLIALLVGFQVFPHESDGVPLGPAQFLAGFGNEALIAICALMIIGKALETTGALQPLVTIVSQTWSTRPLLALLLTLVAVAVLSAFINDTPIVVLMIPILVGISLRAKFPVSRTMRRIAAVDLRIRFSRYLMRPACGYASSCCRLEAGSQPTRTMTSRKAETSHQRSPLIPPTLDHLGSGASSVLCARLASMTPRCR